MLEKIESPKKKIIANTHKINAALNEKNLKILEKVDL